MNRPTIVLLLFIAPFAPAQGSDSSRADPFAVIPSKELIAAAQEYNTDAIVELGRRRERSSIGVLNKIASEPDDNNRFNPTDPSELSVPYRIYEPHAFVKNRSRLAAKIALARMGDEKYLNEFIIGLSSSSAYWRFDCIRRLGDIGDKRAVKYLVALMDAPPPPARKKTSTPPPHHGNFGHIDGGPHFDYLLSASLAIEQLVPGATAVVQEKLKKEHLSYVDAWKEWLHDHRAEYEK